MLGIWHAGEWMKRYLAKPFYSWVERGSPISGWFIAFFNRKVFPLIFMCKGINIFVDLMVVTFVVYLSLLFYFYYAYFMTLVMYGF